MAADAEKSNDSSTNRVGGRQERGGHGEPPVPGSSLLSGSNNGTVTESSKRVWSSPLLVAVIGLVATILASIVQNQMQGQANRQPERQKFESALIQKALDTQDPKQAGNRLGLLLNLGFITDKDGKISWYVSHPDSIPLQPERPVASTQPGQPAGITQQFELSAKVAKKTASLQVAWFINGNNDTGKASLAEALGILGKLKVTIPADAGPEEIFELLRKKTSEAFSDPVGLAEIAAAMNLE